MSYPNRNHVSRADRHARLTGDSADRRWGTAGYELTRMARRALGLTGDRYGRNETAQGVMPDGRPVKLVPSPRSGSGRKGMLMRRIQILCDQCNQWIPMGRIQQHEGTGTCYRNRGRGRTTRDAQRDPEEELNPHRIDLKPGRKNPARRGLVKKPLIGRRKTVRTSAKGLMSRRTRKGAKRAMFRMNQKAKLLACHACNRTDFASEKSLKLHTAKFHTPGQKSPRGFRTRRDPSDPYNGKLTFHDNDGGEVLDTQNCTGRRDARGHAEHLAAEYGCTVVVKREGKYLCTVREYGS